MVLGRRDNAHVYASLDSRTSQQARISKAELEVFYGDAGNL